MAVGIAAPLAAAIGCLQPGIDPVFLTFLSHANAIPTAAHGLVVGATQGGAALGALAVWRLGETLRHGAVVTAAAVGAACSLMTPWMEGTAATLAIRLGYGLAMGMVYARAMSDHAARRPGRAYASVYLAQLLLATLASELLPEAAVRFGPDAALELLALAPALAFAALLIGRPAAADHTRQAQHRAPVPLAGWALAAATFWFICTTMLVWSSTAALASAAGIADRTIGHAVAIGSVVGAATALVLMRDRRIAPLPVTALLCGLSLAAPLAMTAPGADLAFIASVIALNIGSTAIIIRCSALATAASPDARFRTFVACTHALGTIAGPLLAAAIMQWRGLEGLPLGVAASLCASLGAIAIACHAGRSRAGLHPFKPGSGQSPSQVRMALD
ncbi:MAG: hypothetical protein RIS94_847 [Pseudomonadota bacterium]